MPTSPAAVLSVRVSATERALLEAAAEQASTNLSDFVRRRALEAAETDLLNRRIVTIPAKDWARFEAWASSPPRDSTGASKTVQDSPRLAEVTSGAMAAFAPPRPLAADDDTAAFDCGRDALNNWFRRHAWRNQELGASRTSVICAAEAGNVVGYVSLSTAQVERAWLPKPQQRNRPDPLPAILLGQLAVDLRWQGQGIARSLMFYALTTGGAPVRASRLLLRADPSAG